MKLFTINGVYIKAFSKLHGLEHGFVRHWLNLSMFKLLAQKVYIFVSKLRAIKEFCQPLDSSFCVDTFQKRTFYFITEASEDCKSGLSQFALTDCSLSNEFVPQEISQTTSSLYSWLHSQFSKLENHFLRLKNRESGRNWLSTCFCAIQWYIIIITYYHIQSWLMKLTLQPKKSHSCQFHRVLLICWSLNWRYEPEKVQVNS